MVAVLVVAHISWCAVHGLFHGALWMVTVISWCSLVGCCYFQVPWMGVVVSSCTLDGCCYFLVRSGWLLVFCGALWMGAIDLWCAPDGRCSFVVHCGWSLIFCGAPLMVAVPGKILECVWCWSVVYWWRPLDTPLREFICIDTLITLRPGGSWKKNKQTIPPRGSTKNPAALRNPAALWQHKTSLLPGGGTIKPSCPTAPQTTLCENC